LAVSIVEYKIALAFVPVAVRFYSNVIFEKENISNATISDRLGIPLESQQTVQFDIIEVTAIKKTNVFESVIAPTTQNGYSQPGGGVQTLITDRSAFSAPEFTGKKFP
jgi:hypothetical protein